MGLKWVNSTSNNGATIGKTQIMRSTGTFITAVVIGEVDAKTTSWTATDALLEFTLFYWVRHVSKVLGVAGPTNPAGSGLPGKGVAPAGKQCATPLIGIGPSNAVAIGVTNYRVLIVDQQGALGPADLFFSINDGTFLPYSKTGNYKTVTAGTVLPTTNNGEISCGVGDKINAYATQTGWLQSATTTPFYNNATNAPNRDGTGTGTRIAKLPY